MESHYASLEGISKLRVKQSVVREDQLVLQDESQHGVFFSGDCYVVEVFYEKDSRQYHTVYFWLGSHRTSME